MRRIVFALISAAFMTACGTGPGTSVAIKVGTPGVTASPSSAAMFSVAGGATDVPGHIEGTNGELRLSSVWVIVEEFELEPVETAECDDDDVTDDCEDFEQEYFFISLPLDGTDLAVVSANVPDGSYDELEFEIDDAEVDPNDLEDLEDAALIDMLFDDIVAQGFPNWPREASMLVSGTWQAKDGTGALVGDPIGFNTYFDAKIEVELDLIDLYTVDNGTTSGDITILMDPAAWFLRDDNTVWNLLDLEGQMVDFRLRSHHGFDVKID